MDQISVNTTQNVNLNYRAAGVGLRILAALIDGFIVFAYSFLIIYIFVYAINRHYYSGNYDYNESYNQVMIGFLILCLLPAGLYHLICETFMNGQSFGKKLMKIKVVKLDGTQPNFGSYLIRSLFRLIDRPLIAVVTVAVSKYSQRFGDMVAGTTVIHLNNSLSLQDTILYRQVPEYTIVYPQVALMTDRDANTIREVLEFSVRQQQFEHLRLLSNKIKEKYGITDVKQADGDFLSTLLMDYTHYQFES